MLYWIISVIFHSIANIFYKKWLNLKWEDTNFYIYAFLWEINFLLCVGLLIISPYFIFNYDSLTSRVFFLILLVSIFAQIKKRFNMYANSREHISVLAPFSSFSKIFGAILWFIILPNNSSISLIFSILALMIIVLSSINYKNFKISKYCIIVWIAWFFSAMWTVLTWYILLSITTIDFIVFRTVVSILLLLIIIFLLWKYKNIDYKNFEQITKLRFFDKAFYIVSFVIMLNLMQDIWIVKTFLIWMLLTIMNLILSYFIFRDIPKLKNIIVSLSVMICVFLGVFLG